MRWILMSMAAVGMLGCTVVLLGALAFRSSQANRELAEVVAAKQAASAANEAGSKVVAPVAPRPKTTSKANTSPNEPNFDPAFESFWNEFLAIAKISYAQRESRAEQLLAALPAAHRAEAVALMATIDVDPYRELPIKRAFFYEDKLHIWMVFTGALAATHDPDFKVFAAGIWAPGMWAERLVIIAGQFACLSPSLRQGVVETVRKKIPVAEMRPRIRYELHQMWAERLVPERTYDQIWADLHASAECIEEEAQVITPRYLERSPADVRSVAEAIMAKVRIDPFFIETKEAHSLELDHKMTFWHLSCSLRAALADPQFSKIIAALHRAGASWDDHYRMTKRFYWEDSGHRAEILAAMTNDVPTRNLDPDLRKRIANMGGQKWLDR